jgi:hypothetical protein
VFGGGGFGRVELVADVLGVRGAEVGAEREGLLPVAARLGQVAGGVVAAGEAVVGAGLLVLAVDLAGRPSAMACWTWASPWRPAAS